MHIYSHVIIYQYITCLGSIYDTIMDIYYIYMNENNILSLPVSLGEAIDKLTILHIKCDKITDQSKNRCPKRI